MTPNVSAHIDAVMGLLRSKLGTGLPGYNAEAPKTAKPPYWVAYFDPGHVDSSSVARENDALGLYIQIRAVGEGPEQVMWAMDLIRPALLDNTLTVPGRDVWPVEQERQPLPLQRDDDVSPALFWSLAEFRLRSFPA